MPRTLLLSVTAPAGSKQDLCGLYRVSGVDPSLSDNQAGHTAQEALMSLTGMDLLFGAYSINVFDQDSKERLDFGKPEGEVQLMACEKTSDALPGWVLAHLS